MSGVIPLIIPCVAGVVVCLALAVGSTVLVFATFLNKASLYGDGSLASIAERGATYVGSSEWWTTIMFGGILLLFAIGTGIFTACLRKGLGGSQVAGYLTLLCCTIATGGYAVFYSICVLVNTARDCAILSYCNCNFTAYDASKFGGNITLWEVKERANFECVEPLWIIFVAMVVAVAVLMIVCCLSTCLACFFPEVRARATTTLEIGTPANSENAVSIFSPRGPTNPYMEGFGSDTLRAYAGTCTGTGTGTGAHVVEEFDFDVDRASTYAEGPRSIDRASIESFIMSGT